MPILGDICPARARSDDEEPDRTVRPRVLALRGRHGERRHRVDPFPFRPEGLAAGGEDAQRRTGSQQSLGQRRSGGDHMLAGVQHQHQPPVGERLRHALR
jgi:hypothetical protein